jgi:microcystin-dependent protein
MGTPYVGEIILVGFTFAPVGWALCDGHLLPIAQNDTLFQLIGTTYGGDGQTTFAVPDLRGRIPIGQGQGPSLQNYIIGQVAGSEAVTLTVNQIPNHTHTVNSSGLTATAKCRTGTPVANQRTPVGNVHAVEAAGVTMPYSSAAPDAVMNADPVTISGNTAATGTSTAHDNRQPFLTMNYCISLFGVFPSQ